MFSRNLKYYRLLKNMTQKELAGRIHVTPMTITNYEKGKRMPDMDMIQKLAHELGVRVTDFLISRNDQLVFSHGEFRKTSRLSASKQEYIREYIEEYFSRFFDAVDCNGGRVLPDPLKCHSKKLSNDVEENAIRLRKFLGLPEHGPIGNLVLLLENMGVFILFVDCDDNQFSGLNGLVNDYPYIAVNQSMTPERIRSTIAHELAHLVFDWNGIVDEKEKENMATAISGAFLISERDLKRELGLYRNAITQDFVMVCKEYGISSLLLVKRGEIAKIIPAHVAKDFYIKAGKAGWRKNEPSRIPQEESTLLKQLVLRAVNDQSISIQKGAELLKTSYSEIEDECRLVEVA